MKAWSVYNDYTGFGTVVYAETSGKAKQAAMHTDVMEDYSFKEIRVRRCKPMDALYQGSSEMDWYDIDTRMILVRDCGWYCIDPDEDECEHCPATEHCAEYIYAHK